MADPSAGKAFPVSWDQFHRDCRALTWRLNEVGPFHAVIAITRGGLVPAAIVARELGVRIIDTVCIASYDHTKQGDLKVLKGISPDTAKLGAGTGKALLIAEKEFGAHAIGFEISTIFYIIGKINLFIHGSRATLVKKNLFDADLKSADVIFCFLAIRTMQKMEDKIKTGL